MIWHIPTWSGDYRLVEDLENAKQCLLSIEKPTETEKGHLKKFFMELQAKGWLIGTTPRLTKKTVYEMVIDAPLTAAGPLLLKIIHGEDTSLWTGIKSTSGTIALVDSRPGLIQKAITAVVGASPPTALATVREPARGCPAPEPCNVRASEVLRTFSTKKQFADFTNRGFMAVNGSVTGRRYFLFHRNEAAKRGLSHSLVGADDGLTRCVYHPTLPAEEEALATKFLVEHREGLLLQDNMVFVRPELR